MFFIPEAMAAAETTNSTQGLLMQVLPIVVIFAAFWFFLIRPQQKRQKEHQKMVQALTKGDEVMTIGGLMGRVLEVEESRILMQIASVEGKPVSIYMNRASVQVVLPKDTVQL